jgi:molybdopterin synthase catalytic subunit
MKTDATITDGPLPEPCGPVFTAGAGADAGAVLRFEGVVRSTEDGRAIEGLTYQTYDPMAQRQLLQLAQQATEQFSLLAVVVEHSRGFVPAGQCSFRLWIAAGHRKPSLAAMDWFIDQMKRDVPIWKSPVFVDNACEPARKQETAT